MKRALAVVPVKDPEIGKSRLASLLGQSQRRALNLRLALHTLQICSSYFGGESTIVVTASRDIQKIAREHSAIVLNEENGASGLDQALRVGGDFAIHAGAGMVVVIPTDLPLLSVPLLRAALGSLPPEKGCVLVPDRRGSGTNLMAVCPIDTGLFSFGELSLERHRERARERGYEVRIYRSPELSIDIDIPEDLRFLREAHVLEKHHADKCVESLQELLDAS